jgi:IstB-like ATP binding protein
MILTRRKMAAGLATFAPLAPALAATTNDPQANRAAAASLRKLIAGNAVARDLNERAVAVLVFPKIVKVGFILDGAYGEGSLLITSQVPIGRWHEIIGDPTLGDAILDRVIHRSHRIELKGESLRKRQALAAVEGSTNAKEK